jgi:hypothetical protein
VEAGWFEAANNPWVPLVGTAFANRISGVVTLLKSDAASAEFAASITPRRLRADGGASAKFEAARALLPKRAPRLADLEAKLFAFPGSRDDYE